MLLQLSWATKETLSAASKLFIFPPECFRLFSSGVGCHDPGEIRCCEYYYKHDLVTQWVLPWKRRPAERACTRVMLCKVQVKAFPSPCLRRITA